jgi:hypothetical protein
LTAVGLLASVWARTTIRAVLAVYLFLGAGLALARAFEIPILAFDFGPTGDDSYWERHGPTGVFLLIVIVICLVIAVARLRPAHEKQRSSAGAAGARSKVKGRIEDAPIRWKEQHAGGWAAIPLWGALPQWCRLVLVMLATAGVTLMPPTSEERIILLALAVFVSSSLWVGVRCAGAITSEREKQTWDALLVTLLDARQIVRGKLWGNIDAVAPYLIAYLPPAVFGAIEAGPAALVSVLYLWLANWLFLYFIAACGLHASARSTSTWRSLIAATLKAIGMALYAGLIAGVPITSCFMCGICALEFRGALPPTPVFTLAFFLLTVPTPILVWLFALSESLLEQAEQEWLILRENAGRTDG